jgi:phosphomannomutase
MRVYAEQLRNIIKIGVSHPESYDEPLKGFRIIVDAGNGSGGFFAEEVLQPLGADITGAWGFSVSCREASSRIPFLF